MALAEGDTAAARARLTEALTVLRDGGQVWGIPSRLQELAWVAQAQGQPERAARLWGAGAAQYQALLGRPVPAAQRLSSDALTLGLPTTTREQAAEAIRVQLGEAGYAAAWAEGQAMPLEQAIAYALEAAPAAA